MGRLGDSHVSSPDWRSSSSTLARDNGTARDVVELALDHVHDNEVARAYDRGERFDERVKLFDWWGKQLAAAQRGATIIPIKTKAAGWVNPGDCNRLLARVAFSSSRARQRINHVADEA